MFGKKKEEGPKFLVMPKKDVHYETRPRVENTLEAAGKVVFDYPSLYEDIYEIGKKLDVDVHLHVRIRENE